MEPRILLVIPADAQAMARDIAPPGFHLNIAQPRTAEYQAALPETDYLVGFVDMLVNDALYRAAPKLRLIQLLSAGYDRADIAAARRAKVPVAHNGGANAVAVSEHALMLMLAVSRRLIRVHADVAAGRWR